MAKSTSKTSIGLYTLIGILLVLVVIFLVLYALNLSSYGSLKSNYNTLQSSYNSEKSNFSTLQANYNKLLTKYATLNASFLNLSKIYNATEYNLTHPYVKILADKQVVTIPPETYNYTAGSYEAPSYNFSFYAPYPGYLIVNYTVSPINNNLLNSTFAIYVTNEKPYYSNGVVTINSYVSPFERFDGSNGQTAILPIINGTNYILLTNYNNQTVTAEFSMKYVGFHTS